MSGCRKRSAFDTADVLLLQNGNLPSFLGCLSRPCSLREVALPVTLNPAETPFEVSPNFLGSSGPSQLSPAPHLVSPGREYLTHGR